MPRQQPHVIGVVRDKTTARMHSEVIRNLKDIARRENKSFAWVVSEIVYQYFGLKVTDDLITIRKETRKKNRKKGRVLDIQRFRTEISSGHVRRRA